MFCLVAQRLFVLIDAAKVRRFCTIPKDLGQFFSELLRHALPIAPKPHQEPESCRTK